MSDCPGVCNALHRRQLAAGVPAKDRTPAREGAPVWCRPCQGEIVSAIGSLPGLAAGLFQMGHETGRLVGPSDLNGGIRATRIHAPTASPAWEAIDELVSWAAETERRLRATLGQARSPRWTGGTTEQAAAVLRRASRYLCEWSTPLLCAPFADELGAVIPMAKRAEKAAGLDRHVVRLTKACPKCEKPRLVRTDGTETVRCRSCGVVLTGSSLAKVFDTTA